LAGQLSTECDQVVQGQDRSCLAGVHTMTVIAGR
jgi:hypothetical protein